MSDRAWTVHQGDCREVMAAMEPDTFDTIISDPPYGIEFMGRDWDAGVPGTAFWRGALRVAKPGASLLAFGGTRTFHRLAVAIEDAGWEIRDCLVWLYGTGFPKSLDVGKAIDRRRDDRAEVLEVTAWIRESRDAAGLTNEDIDRPFGFRGMGGHWTTTKSQPQVPRLDQVARLLEVLRVPDPPERIRALLYRLNGRKGTPGDDWLARDVTGQHDHAAPAQVWKENYGIEADTTAKEQRDAPATELAARWDGWGTALKPAWEPIVLAMKPTDGTFADNARKWDVAGLNVDGSRVGTEEMDVQESDGTVHSENRAMGGHNTGRNVTGTKAGRWPTNVLLDPEAAAMVGKEVSRFFYVAKASAADRGNESLPTLPLFGVEAEEIRNPHPTVKPTELMRYLVRLTASPAGGVILDPFMGSGSTLVAAKMEGRPAVGIEINQEYCEVARRRLAETREGVV